MSKLAATLVAVVFATGTAIGPPAWAERGNNYSGRGHPVNHFPANSHRDRGGDGWLLGLGLLAGTAILLSANDPRPVVSSPPVVVYPGRPTIYLPPAPSETAYANSTNQWWYYCAKPAGYYPYVNQCPTGWTKVSPRPPD